MVETPAVDIRVRETADALAVAERTRRPMGPLSEAWPDLDLAGAYAVQRINVDRRIAAGDAVRGYKVGLTSLAMQRQLGVDQPDFGTVLDTMVVPDGGRVPCGELIAPRIEAEIAFMLGEDLAGDAVTSADVAAATASVVPALEIIDSRIRDWRITLLDTVADNASSARVVLGGCARPLPDSLRTLGVVLERDGEVVATGAGAASLGDPLEAVAWLARTLSSVGERLSRGQFVMSGALHAAIPIEPGMTISAEAHGLGRVSVEIV